MNKSNQPLSRILNISVLVRVSNLLWAILPASGSPSHLECTVEHDKWQTWSWWQSKLEWCEPHVFATRFRNSDANFVVVDRNSDWIRNSLQNEENRKLVLLALFSERVELVIKRLWIRGDRWRRWSSAFSFKSLLLCSIYCTERAFSPVKRQRYPVFYLTCCWGLCLFFVAFLSTSNTRNYLGPILRQSESAFACFSTQTKAFSFVKEPVNPLDLSDGVQTKNDKERPFETFEGLPSVYLFILLGIFVGFCFFFGRLKSSIFKTLEGFQVFFPW